jgi:iron-regulated transporter 1
MTRLGVGMSNRKVRDPAFVARNFCRMNLLVVSYAFTTWNVRSEEWATAMFLTYLYPNSLLPVSLYSLVSSAASMLFGPWIGLLVDKTPRLFLVLLTLILQKCCIIGITVLIWSIVDFRLDFVPSDQLLGWKFGLIVALGAVLRLTNVITNISLERDWPKRVEEDEVKLSALLGSLKRVDLVSKLGSPLFVSSIASFSTIPITILAMGGISVLSTVVEWVCLIWVYRSNKGLRRGAPSTEDTIAETQTVESAEVKPFFASLKESMQKLEFTTCVTMAILYFNVLSFGPVMVSYLLHKNVHATVIAAVRGAGVVIGILATITFSNWTKRIGVPRTGLWSLSIEMIFLGIACISFAIPDPLTSVIVLLVGVNLSRYGLWTFDLSQNQLLQESYDEGLGSLNGIQVSMQNIFELLGYGSTVLWPYPEQFWLPSLLSFSCVFMALVLYTVYIKYKRGHILHLEKLPLLGNDWYNQVE